MIKSDSMWVSHDCFPPVASRLPVANVDMWFNPTASEFPHNRNCWCMVLLRAWWLKPTACVISNTGSFGSKLLFIVPAANVGLVDPIASMFLNSASLTTSCSHRPAV